MKYELNIFEDIIHGSLSPLNYNKSQEEYLNLIWESNRECYSIVYATLKKTRDSNYTLVSKKSINGLNPYAKNFADRQMDLFMEAKLSDYNTVLAELGIKADDVIETHFNQQPKKYLLMIKHRIDISKVPHQELKYYYYSLLLKKEFLRLTQHIRDSVFGFKSNEKILNFIHKLQHALVGVSYRLVRLINPIKHDELYREPTEFTNAEILRMTYTCVEELQKFLEKNYFTYLDRNIPVPYRSSLLKLYDLSNKLSQVKTTLFKEVKNEDLLKVVYNPLLKLSFDVSDTRITYKELTYLNTYLTAFYDKIKENNYTISIDEVVKLLFVVNFNDQTFINYKLCLYRNSTEILTSDREKIDYLYKQLKNINQRPSNLSIVYNAQHPSLKAQLTEWIEEELNYLNKREQLFAKPETPGIFYEGETLKLQSGLTVAALSFFYKVQSEVGIITHKTQKDIFKHVADNYITSKAPQISSDSVSSKFYNIEPITIKAVKEKVIEMLNYIKEGADH